jgi:glycosyltransferase involved in cell wall biosynthesis
MRILLACEFFYPSVGGVQEVVRQVAERLVARGHDVTVATSHIPTRSSLDLNGIKIVEFKVSGNAVGGLAGEVDAYRERVLRGDYDVFMVKAAQQWTFDALLPVLDRIENKVFVPCGFSSLNEPAYARYYREMPMFLGKFNHLIFYASDYRDINLAKAHGLSNFSIVPNGASELEFNTPPDRRFRQRHGIGEETFVILTVGSFTGEKGHRELADAFLSADFGTTQAALILNGNFLPRAARPGLRAAVGHGRRILRPVKWFLRGRRVPPRGIVEPIRVIVDAINRSTPTKRAVLVNLPRAELVQAYLNSDLFVFASNIEYSPLVLYESAAAGLPFLTVPVGNAPEIAQWTGGGVVCPAPQDERGYTRVDPKVLGEQISRLASDRPLLQALGGAGRTTWSERFTWERIASQYEAIFEEVIQDGRPQDTLAESA